MHKEVRPMATIDIRGATLSAADPPIATNPSPDLAIKAPVLVATTGSNIVLSGVQTIDGVTVGNANERVLVKDQTDRTTNGLYNAATGPWTRTIDADNNSQWTTGTQIAVTGGSVNASKTYQLITATPIVLGTSLLSFSVVSAANALADAQILVGQSGGGSAAKSVSGDVSLADTGAMTIAANAVTNAKAAQMAANTIKGNNTGATANAADLTVPQVAAMFSAPQVTVFNSGSGTYTTPANAKYLVVEMAGGGAGGAGGGSGSPGGGTSGGTSTFATLTCTGGAAGTGTGGTGSGGDINIQGGSGGQTYLINSTTSLGGSGGVSFFGGNGTAVAGGVGSTATGPGSGGGGGSGTSSAAGGSGGSAGGYLRRLIVAPAASYAYSVAAAGTAGGAGTNGFAGGAGAPGIIIVTAYFQ
jgi:hypothetical protein